MYVALGVILTLLGMTLLILNICGSTDSGGSRIHGYPVPFRMASKPTIPSGPNIIHWQTRSWIEFGPFKIHFTSGGWNIYTLAIDALIIGSFIISGVYLFIRSMDRL
jgi:hypothetical protein